MKTDVHTLPETNPLRRRTDQIRKFRGYHRSPLYQVADTLKIIDMETLKPSMAPWEARVRTNLTAISGSARNGLVGFGVAIEKQPPRY